MKTYTVNCGTDVNGTYSVSTHTNLADAKIAFDKEVQQMETDYIRQDKLPYSPTDYEQSHAFFCEIMQLEDNPDSVDISGIDATSIEMSDYYYER